MKIKQISIPVFYAYCPHCGDNMIDPETDSFQIEPGHITKLTELVCSGCDKKSKLPNDTVKQLQRF